MRHIPEPSPNTGWCSHACHWSTTKSRLIESVGEPPVSGVMGNVGCGELRIMKDLNYVCHNPNNFPMHVETQVKLCCMIASLCFLLMNCMLLA